MACCVAMYVEMVLVLCVFGMELESKCGEANA